ncbi:MAG: LysM peptidoglycan-binding domain-containing protein [Bacilli bacterium]|nr:LysM peptidoglycan-binding domain-containing protein [Bacilli bacterium]
MSQYIVQSGDTLYGIAKQFGTTVDEIKRLNNLSGNVITKGQVLTIKEDTTTPNTYVVVKGDSLYTIGKKFGVTPEELMRLNNLSSNILQIGQVLKIPSKNGGTTAPDNVTYIVVKGDSLYTISKKFGLTVDELMKYNNLSSTSLQIGQILKIPSTSDDSGGVIITPIYENYTVKKGDSLYTIAKRFNTTVEQIKKDNNLTSTNLSIGQVLKIKVGEETIGVEECYGEGFQDVEKNYITYTVKKGDNLYTIAKNYNTSVGNIKKLNNLVSDNLSIGQVLKIKEVT